MWMVHAIGSRACCRIGFPTRSVICHRLYQELKPVVALRVQRASSIHNAQSTNSVNGAEPKAPNGGSPDAREVNVYFKAQDVLVSAKPGDNLLEVAQRCDVNIPTGCLCGSCGTCEVEVTKYGDGDSDPSPVVVRACIAGVPPGYKIIEVDDVSDPIWGVDGMDL